MQTWRRINMAMKKGISPVVASVILVAAAVLIGAVATVFVSSFVGQKTTQANTAGCAVTNQFTISDAQVNSTGAVRVKLSNSGQGTVSNFTIEVTLTNGTIERKLALSPSSTANITSGQSTFVMSNVFDANVDNLVGEVKVTSDACKQFYAPTSTV